MRTCASRSMQTLLCATLEVVAQQISPTLTRAWYDPRLVFGCVSLPTHAAHVTVLRPLAVDVSWARFGWHSSLVRTLTSPRSCSRSPIERIVDVCTYMVPPCGDGSPWMASCQPGSGTRANTPVTTLAPWCGRYSTKSDVFAIGVVLAELVQGRHPFGESECNEDIERVQASTTRSFRPHVSLLVRSYPPPQPPQPPHTTPTRTTTAAGHLILGAYDPHHVVCIIPHAARAGTGPGSTLHPP